MTERASTYIALLSAASCFAISFIGLHALAAGPGSASSPFFDPFVLIAFVFMAGVSWSAPTFGNVLGLGFAAGTVGAFAILLLRFLTGLDGIGLAESAMLALPFLFKGVVYAGPIYVAAFIAKATKRYNRSRC